MNSTKAEEKPTEIKTFRTERQTRGESTVKQKIIRKSWEESKKMWEIAGPAILVSVSQFSIGFVTVAFAGHLGELQLAVVTITTNVIEGFVFSIMVSDIKTLDSYLPMIVSLCSCPCLVRNEKCTRNTMRSSRWRRIKQHARNLSPKIMDHNRNNRSMSNPMLPPHRTDTKPTTTRQGYRGTCRKKYCRMVIPHLGCLVLLNWALVTKLELGLLGAAMARNISWWLQVIAMVVYVGSGFFRIPGRAFRCWPLNRCAVSLNYRLLLL
ncbi:hypothetical protein F3Y22_tig00111092pilonHSYRG00097 [Hibiscus syriacus]|uniref:Uncharacterized protein n=1 Tax=Hibiscus syriacus TaxID=106335 RepID=A0A6A2Z204_HIBSY|nr:hypothetical protein F3Y22_tig00111092pilonHSYRG00097 [Hibiscus syriacus]